jgi:hypothetical protein
MFVHFTYIQYCAGRYKSQKNILIVVLAQTSQEINCNKGPVALRHVVNSRQDKSNSKVFERKIIKFHIPTMWKSIKHYKGRSRDSKGLCRIY